jgi:type IV pilus assembly protein PilW
MVLNARASMDMMASEITMAGYNPAGAVFSGIPYDSSKLQLYADLNGNGVLTDSSENITYTYDAANKRIVRNTGNGNQPFAENIQALNFEYLDSQGNPTTVTANIRQIRLTIIVQSSKPDPYYTPNSGYRTYSLKSLITPRNLAY